MTYNLTILNTKFILNDALEGTALYLTKVTNA